MSTVLVNGQCSSRLEATRRQSLPHIVLRYCRALCDLQKDGNTQSPVTTERLSPHWCSWCISLAHGSFWDVDQITMCSLGCIFSSACLVCFMENVLIFVRTMWHVNIKQHSCVKPDSLTELCVYFTLSYRLPISIILNRRLWPIDRKSVIFSKMSLQWWKWLPTTTILYYYILLLYYYNILHYIIVIALIWSLITYLCICLTFRWWIMRIKICATITRG